MESEKMYEKKSKKKLSKSAKVLLYIVIAVVVVTVLVIAVQIANLPLAPTMTVVTATPNLTSPTQALTNTPIYVVVTSTPNAETATAAAIPTSTPLPTATAENSSICNESGNMNILLIGTDEDSGVWPPGAEMIRVINVDFTNQTIAMVAFPRDLYVPTSGLAASGMPQQTLGLTYFYAKQTVRGDAKALAAYGASTLARTLLEDFNVTVDHYIVVDADAIPALIDKVGGITVTLDYDLAGYDGRIFRAGTQTLYGADVLNLVRVKGEETEAGRFARQQMVISAFLEKAVSLQMLPRLASILNELGSDVITDLSLSQLSNMGCLVTHMDRSRISSYNLQNDSLTYYSTSGLLLPNTQAISDVADDYLH